MVGCFALGHTCAQNPEEPQSRGDVYASTERSYADEPAELRVGFSGSRSSGS